MIKEHREFTLPSDFNSVLYRYTDFRKFRSLIETKSLYFSRADLLGDKFEGSYSEPAIKFRNVMYKDATPEFREKGLSKWSLDILKASFVSCWHSDTHESEAMWQAYSRFNKNIAIKSTVRKLRDYILDNKTDFLLGFVKYIDYKTDFQHIGNMLSQLFYKRREYRHEQEFRIIDARLLLLNQFKDDLNKIEKGILVSVDLKNLIENIIISPYLNKSAYQEIVDYLLKVGLSNKLKKSSFEDTPHF